VLDALSFVQHFTAGTVLQQIGDRVTCAFLAFEGKLLRDGCRRAVRARVRNLAIAAASSRHGAKLDGLI
jgi:hypothetical protein